MESDKAEKPPAETPPDHLSIDPKNSYYNEAILNPAAADSDADAVVKVTLNDMRAACLPLRSASAVEHAFGEVQLGIGECALRIALSFG